MPWQRAASVLMARGEVEDGLRAYGRHGRIALVAGAVQAQERVIALWTDARARHGDGEVIIATRQNRDAAALNAAARHVLRREGKLTGDDMILQVRDRDDHAGRLALAVGDRLRFGEGLSQHLIRNGTRGVVTAVGPDDAGELRLAVHLEDGRTVQDAFADFVPGGARRRRRQASSLPRIGHAYAGTVYAAQGRTVAEAVLYVGAATGPRGRSTSASPAIGTTPPWWWSASGSKPPCGCAKPTPAYARATPNCMSGSTSRADVYADKRNVIDHVEDRAAFIRTGELPPPAPEPRIDIRRGVEAGRRLGTVMREIAVAPGLALSQLARLVPGRRA